MVIRLHRLSRRYKGVYFLGCAAGEGSLLEVLPAGVRKIATTLEAEDVALLKIKGL